MRSRTKRDLTGEEIDQLVAEAFGGERRVVARAELADGMFNAAWRLTLDGAAGTTEVVLKVSPPPDVPLLAYERDIMRTEAMFFRWAEGHALMPTLHYAGLGRSIVDSDFLVLSALDGVSWDKAKKRLTAGERAALRTELGAMVAGLHTVRGDQFGYPQPAAGLTGSDWPQAFSAMLNAVLADAARFGVVLPVDADVIKALPERYVDALAEVTVPALVHFDLWDGNIFLDLAGRAADRGGPSIEGLIDAERAFWGDPHADFVSLALFGDIETDTEFLAGYRGAGGVVAFTPALRRRLSLYKVYLYLIMIVEGAPRGYTSVTQRLARKYFASKLKAALRGLDGGRT